MIFIALFFSALYLCIAFLNYAGRVHGADPLPLFTGIHLALSFLLIWAAYFKFRSKERTIGRYIMFIGLGLIPVPVGMSVWTLAARFEQAMLQRRDSRIEISNVRDEPFISKKGNLVGLKFHFSVSVPQHDYYSLSPAFHLPDDIYRRAWKQTQQNSFDPSAFSLNIIKIRVDPPVQLAVPRPWGQMEKGKVYRFTLYAVPGYLIPQQGKSEFCLWQPPDDRRKTFEWIIGRTTPGRYQAIIYHTGIALQSESQTRISQKALYDGIRKEGFGACDRNLQFTSGDVYEHEL